MNQYDDLQTMLRYNIRYYKERDYTWSDLDQYRGFTNKILDFQELIVDHKRWSSGIIFLWDFGGVTGKTAEQVYFFREGIYWYSVTNPGINFRHDIRELYLRGLSIRKAVEIYEL